MSKLKLTLILLFVVILGGLSGAIYYASTLVSPDEVRRLTLEKLEETFPNSEIELGKIEFSMGPTFKFDLEKLAINAPKNDPKKLFAVEDIHVKVPVWAILFGGGEIDVRIQSPELNYASIKESNNWAQAMQQKEKPAEAKTEKQASSENEGGGAAAVVVPGFLANSQLNLRVTDLKTKYQIDEQKGEFEVSKFLVRNLNFEASTAFELDSKLSFEMGPSQEIDFETLIIGQFNLGTYIKKNELPIMAVIKISNLTGPMLSKPLSEIKTDINLLVKKEEVTGAVELSLLKDVKLSADLMTSDSKTGLSNLAIHIPLSEVTSLLDLKVESLDMSKATLKANGGVNILKNGEIVPDLKLTVEPSVTQTFMGEKFSHKLEASLEEKNFESKLTSELFSGTMIAKTSGKLDLNQEISMENLPRFNSSVNLTSLTISRGFIQAAIYSEKTNKPTQEKQDQAEGQAQGAEQTPLVIPPGNLTLTMTNIDLGGEVLSGEGVFEAQKSFVVTKSFDFEYSGGKGTLTHLSKVKGDSLGHQFDFGLKGFNLAGLQAFLPPALGKVSGAFNLQMNGTADTYMRSERAAEFDIVVDALGSDGEAQVLVELGDKLNDLLSNVPQLAEKLKTKKPLELDGRFDKLSLKSNLTHKKYEMNKVGFVGPGNRFSLEGRGQIFPPVTKKTSVMNFVYRENKGSLVSHLKELTGDNELPFKLSGPGYSMKPDYAHTVEVLAKQTVKTQGKKIIKKEAKKIESKLKDKLDKKSKEKIKDLFGL